MTNDRRILRNGPESCRRDFDGCQQALFSNVCVARCEQVHGCRFLAESLDRRTLSTIRQRRILHSYEKNYLNYKPFNALTPLGPIDMESIYHLNFNSRHCVSLDYTEVCMRKSIAIFFIMLQPFQNVNVI